jgi:hypothetical protein
MQTGSAAYTILCHNSVGLRDCTAYNSNHSVVEHSKAHSDEVKNLQIFTST